MRKGKVFYNNMEAGFIIEYPEKYIFYYSKEYLDHNNPQISITLPLSEHQYESDFIFPFFDGLIPEGWLLDIAEKNWKIDSRDRMGLLLACCKDTIGAVTVERIDENEQ